MPYIVAESFLNRYEHQLTALLSIVLALALAAFVDRALARRGRRLAAAMAGGRLSPVADTRLRFLRRVADATIVVIGIAIALSQFTALDRLAGTVLASSAIAAAVIGFAARQVLANAVAGVMLAITQPLRIGDSVIFEGETGVVEDVRLTYTFLRTGDDARVIIPNERLAGGMLRNESIITETVAAEVSVWLEPGADADRALALIENALPDVTASVAEVTFEGIRVVVSGEPVGPTARASRQAELRAAALRALRGAERSTL